MAMHQSCVLLLSLHFLISNPYHHRQQSLHLLSWPSALLLRAVLPTKLYSKNKDLSRGLKLPTSLEIRKQLPQNGQNIDVHHDSYYLEEDPSFSK